MPATCFALSIVRAPAEGLEVPPELSIRWAALPPQIRRHLATFLAPARPAEAPGALVPRITAAASAAPAPAAPTSAVPAGFLADLAAGGPLLRAAFPRLVRRLASVDTAAADTAVADAAGPLAVHITCEATHDGSFFGFMQPTGRRVRFDEIHHVALGPGNVAEARVELDFRAIIRQLASG